MKANKLAFLNFFRILFAASIVFWHLVWANKDMPLLWAFRNLTIVGGNQGFLFISGMMFALAYYPRLSDGRLTVKDFLIKRAKRIYPLVILTVCLSFALSIAIHFTYDPNEPVSLEFLLQDILFFGGRLFGGGYGHYNQPIWFLSALVGCYLISCLIIVLTKKRKSIAWFLIPCILFAWFYFLNVKNPSSTLIHYKELFGLCANFFIGFYFVFFLKRFETFKTPVRVSLRFAGFGLAMAFLLFFFFNDLHSPFGEGGFMGSLFCWAPLFMAIYGLSINFIFDNAFFSFMGGYTWHLYLWHAVVARTWRATFNWIGYQPREIGMVILAFLVPLATYSATLIYKNHHKAKEAALATKALLENEQEEATSKNA